MCLFIGVQASDFLERPAPIRRRQAVDGDVGGNAGRSPHRREFCRAELASASRAVYRPWLPRRSYPKAAEHGVDHRVRTLRHGRAPDDTTVEGVDLRVTPAPRSWSIDIRARRWNRRRQRRFEPPYRLRDIHCRAPLFGPCSPRGIPARGQARTQRLHDDWIVAPERADDEAGRCPELEPDVPALMLLADRRLELGFDQQQKQSKSTWYKRIAVLGRPGRMEAPNSGERSRGRPPAGRLIYVADGVETDHAPSALIAGITTDRADACPAERRPPCKSTVQECCSSRSTGGLRSPERAKMGRSGRLPGVLERAIDDVLHTQRTPGIGRRREVRHLLAPSIRAARAREWRAMRPGKDDARLPDPRTAVALDGRRNVDRAWRPKTQTSGALSVQVRYRCAQLA